MKEELLKRIHGEDKGQGWISGFCPWHEMPDITNHTPSLIVKDDLSFFKCTTQQCAKGDINILLKKLEMPLHKVVTYDAIDREKLYRWQLDMAENPPDISFLCWNHDICKYLGIGWDGKKFVIPVWKNGNIVQCWKYRPGASQSEKYKGMVKDAEVAIFPNIEVLKPFEGKDLYLSEGYGDTLALLSSGSIAVTAGGKPHWKEEHLEEIMSLKWGNIYLIPDGDKAGRFLGQKLSYWLEKMDIPYKWIMPPDRLKDVTEAFKQGHKITEFPIRTVEEEKDNEESDTIDIRLSDLHQVDPSARLNVEVLVSGKYESPYRIPQKFTVDCDQNSDKLCPICPYGKGTTIEIEKRDSISLIGISKERMESRLKKLLTLRPTRCPGCRVAFSAEDIIYVEELRIKIAHDNLDVDEANCDRKCFYFLKENHNGLLVNNLYKLHGFSASHPETQEICFVADKATAVATDLDKDNKCPDLPFTDIADFISDISYNVTNIFNRVPIHKTVLITLFSPLFCNFNGVRTRCYMEALLIGDSETGKSWVMKNIFKHFGVGRIQDGKLASVAGMLGGINENDRGRRFITPGILAEQDRRIVGIEEIGNMPLEIIHAMREQRTSGVAAIGKIEKASYSARTRLLATANPRSGRRTISSYHYGIEAIFSFIPDPADQRRFDIVHVIADDLEDTQRYKRFQDPVEHKYTQEIARQHLAWAWSIKPEDIHITEEAETLMIQEARRIGKMGHVSLPVFTKTNSLTKILKTSVSMALIKGKTEVGVQEVTEAAEFFIEEYSNLPNGYFDFCEEKYREEVIPFPDHLLATFNMANNPKELARVFKTTSKFSSLREIKDYIIMDIGDNQTRANAFVNSLFKNNCIKKVGHEYYKSAAFVEWIKNNIDNLNEEKSIGNNLMEEI